MSRSYTVPLDSHVTVHVHDDGYVVVEAYLGKLAALIAEDPRVAYSEAAVAEDQQVIERALLASPTNHYMRAEMRDE